LNLENGSSVDWRKVSAALPNRNNKDCRKRWLKIDATWRQGQWSKPEDIALKKAFAIHGSKWKAVSDDIGTRNPDRKQKPFEKRGKTDISQNVQKDGEMPSIRPSLEVIGALMM
jgi:hypothetical protein